MGILAITIGPSGSGKSSYIEDYFEYYKEFIVLSSDSVRGVICGDESDQTKNNIVFSWLKTACEYFIKQNKDVLIDTTALTPETRKDFIDIGKKYDYVIAALVFETPIDLCKTRNRLRCRKVPEHVIDKQFAKFKMPSKEEGFTLINTINFIY